ncbi:MAG: SRPBCC family protein [Solirubrobacteraceae bacterium]
MRCESSVVLPELPGTIFPWLLEAEKVPKWMTGLEVYEPLDPPPLQVGSRIRQHLSVSGQQLKFELRVTELDAPHRAVLRFEGSGFKAANEYTVAEAAEGSKVTWVIDGDTTSFKARLIAPMVQAKLQEKLDHDLARLKGAFGPPH